MNKSKNKEYKMLSEDLKNVSAELGQLAGKVSPSDWDFLRIVKYNLETIASGVQELESVILKDGVM